MQRGRELECSFKVIRDIQSFALPNICVVELRLLFYFRYTKSGKLPLACTLLHHERLDAHSPRRARFILAIFLCEEAITSSGKFMDEVKLRTELARSQQKRREQTVHQAATDGTQHSPSASILGFWRLVWIARSRFRT